MAELRPLIPVLESYRADAALILRFKEEALNVSQELASLQEHVHDFSDVHERVQDLELRLKACMQRLGKSRSRPA